MVAPPCCSPRSVSPISLDGGGWWCSEEGALTFIITVVISGGVGVFFFYQTRTRLGQNLKSDYKELTPFAG